MQCQGAKRGTTRCERSVALPRNAMQVDVIAYDALAERASVGRFGVGSAQRMSV